jgi:hypothetical protein
MQVQEQIDILLATGAAKDSILMMIGEELFR